MPVGAPSGAGRPSAGVRLATDGPYVIAVDLGVDRAVVAGVALGGTILHRAQAPIDGGGEAWQVGASVAGLIRQVVADVAVVRAAGRDRRQRPRAGRGAATA